MAGPAKTLEIRTSPHILSGNSVDSIMFNVVLALMPTTLFAVYAFGLAAVLTVINGFLMIHVLPRGNHALQQLHLEILTQSVSQQVEPRVFYEGWEQVEVPRDHVIVSDMIVNVQTGTGNRIEFWDRRGADFKSKGKIRRFIDVGRLTKGR